MLFSGVPGERWRFSPDEGRVEVFVAENTVVGFGGILVAFVVDVGAVITKYCGLTLETDAELARGRLGRFLFLSLFFSFVTAMYFRISALWAGLFLRKSRIRDSSVFSALESMDRASRASRAPGSLHLLDCDT